MTRGLRLSLPEVDPILDASERSLIERALAHLREVQPRDSGVLWGQVKRVAMLGGLLEQTPLLQLPTTLGGQIRDESSLIDELSRLDPMDGELPLPERAQVARAFLFAKITMLRDFGTALSGAGEPAAALHRELRDELAQSIYTLIATEILIGLLGEPELALRIKLRAARQLIAIWERAAQLEIDDFCPLLEAVWQARSRIGVHFGALLGAGELMRLIREDCPIEFVDYFVRDDVSQAEGEAFQEFLFNVPFEDLIRLRTAMDHEGLSVVNVAAAERILGRRLDAAVVDDPCALYRLYRRRRAASEFRCFTDAAAGPRRTAEAYLMAYVLAADRSDELLERGRD